MTESPNQPSQNSSLPVVSMIFGVLSLTGFFAILSIPAIVTGAIALKKTPENRAFSITGLVTGIVSTILSILFIIFLFFIIIVAAAEEDSKTDSHSNNSSCSSYDRYCSDESSDEEESNPTHLPQAT